MMDMKTYHRLIEEPIPGSPMNGKPRWDYRIYMWKEEHLKLPGCRITGNEQATIFKNSPREVTFELTISNSSNDCIKGAVEIYADIKTECSLYIRDMKICGLHLSELPSSLRTCLEVVVEGEFVGTRIIAKRIYVLR